jgi:RimJ/RimL family protein N-acetyltransferase
VVRSTFSLLSQEQEELSDWLIGVTIYTHFLPQSHISQYGTWLKSLDPATLRAYFGISLGPKGIDSLVRKFKKDFAHHHFLVAEKNSKWVGVIHIASYQETVEFGVIIRKEFRRLGFADKLLGEALIWAQNRQYKKLIMHCIVENSPIRKLCQKHGLIAQNVYGDIEATMNLPKLNWLSVYKEAIQKQVNWYYYLKSFKA